MKKEFLAVLIIALAVGGLYAQDNTPRMKIYRTWISLDNVPYEIKGSLYQISDSAVFVSSAVKIRHYAANRYEITELHYNTINTIKIRRSGSVRRGALLGAISGFAAGFLIGNITTSEDWITGPEVGVIIGVPSALAGAGLGAILGSSKITIPINGKTNSFNQNKNKLREYAIIK